VLDAAANVNGSTVAGGFAYTATVSGGIPQVVTATTILGAGAYTLTAVLTPTDTTAYTTANATTSITVNQASQTIIFAPASPVSYGVSSITLSATGGGSGNAVTLSIVSGPGTISGSTLTVTGAGTIVIAANQAGNTNYSAAVQVMQSIQVNQVSQTITFAPASPLTYGVSPITLSATGGGSGNAVTFNVTSGPATINGSTLTITGAGTVVVTANQAGNVNYIAAPQVTRNIIVNQPSQTIIFAPASPVTYGVPPISLNATGGGSGNPVTFSLLSGPGTISGATLTVTGAGTIVVAADQTGTINYMAATEVRVNIIVNPASQTITFSPLTSPVVYGVSPITLTATGGPSGNTVAFSIVSGPGTITGNTLTVKSAGTIGIAANQAGSSNYSAATQVSQTIVANPAALTVTATNATRLYGATNPTFTGSVSGSVNGDTFTISGTTSATTGSDVGKYAIVPAVTGADISDYTVTPVNGTLTLTQAGSAVILSSSNSSANLNAPITFTATVSSATTGTPTGTVNFLDGQTAIGSGTLSAQGVGTYTTSSFAAGAHSITALYVGNMDLIGSASSALIETVAAPDYAVSVNPTSLTIKQGAAGSAVFTITPVGGFNQAIQFSCSGLPANATCAFSPTTVTPSGASITSTLTITTDVRTSSLLDDRAKPLLAMALHSGQIGLCGGLLFCVFRRRMMTAQLRRLSLGILLAMTLLGAMSVVGCGSGLPPLPVTPAGTSMVTITASTSSPGGPPHNATLALTITQ